MAAATAVDADRLAAALEAFQRVSWPLAAADLSALLDRLAWSVAPDADDEFVQADTGWPVNRSDVSCSLHNGQLTSVSLRLTDVLTEDTPWRDDFLTDSFAATVSVAQATLGKPSSRSKGATPTAYWELANGGRITISRIVSSVTCTVESAEYAAALRTLAT